jgi:predicted lipid-binding transport protein (Tim44 family)
LAVGLAVGLLVGPISGLLSGLAVGLAGMINYGGFAFIQHFILRLILYRNGYTPWDYARFLDNSAERIFLWKVGGGYMFVHRLLLDHFTTLMA